MSDRLVQQIYPAPNKEDRSRLFSDFSAHPNVVLLGDPGAGKTHLLLHSANECGGSRLTAREFLILDNTDLGGAHTIFIDALDEKRAGRGDQNTIDAIVGKLCAVKPTRVRIACRAADWLGETDLAAFKTYFDRNGGCLVLSLQPLTQDERLGILKEQGIDDPSVFIEEAGANGLEELLANPQNLIMLARVVLKRGWPSTRAELYRQSTELLLQEHNAVRARAGNGVYSPIELLNAAGALCAARLIGDVDGICLAETSVDDDFPSYRLIAPLCGIGEAQSALGRRIFMGDKIAETVDYAHRTIAEYLGAAWLAQQVRKGLPIGRIFALIGLDGHPASELRGLHAWLAVLLPERADCLIDADPYGVLSYGDVASLSSPHRQRLLMALGKLAEVDPWFRGDSRSSANLGALSAPDMLAEFQKILLSKDSGFALRSIVLEALAKGAPLPAMKPQLFAILADGHASYAERSNALEALLRMGAEVQALIVDAYRKFGHRDSDIRLRAEILCALYGKPFCPSDVITLLNSVVRCTEGTTGGILWCLQEVVSDADIAEVLNGISAIDPKVLAGAMHRGGAFEVRRVVERLLLRFLATNQPISGDILLRWLMTLSSFTTSYSGPDRALAELRAELGQRSELMRDVVGTAMEALQVVGGRWQFLDQIRKATLGVIDEKDLLEWMANYAVELDGHGDKQAFLFELAIELSFQPEARAIAVFVQLASFSEGRPRLREILEERRYCHIEDWRMENNKRRRVQEKRKERRRLANIKRFTKERDLIANGAHVGWLAWLARLYLGLFADIEKEVSADERIARELGSENVGAALEGLVNGLRRDDLPSLQEVAETVAENKYYEWWYALIAGVTEYVRRGCALEELPQRLLESVLAFDCAHPTFRRKEIGGALEEAEYEWKAKILLSQPKLARDAYLALARTALGKRSTVVQGLYQLLRLEAFLPYRGEIAFELLRDFPDMAAAHLESLLAIALQSTDRENLLALVRNSIGRLSSEDAPGFAEWLGAAYLLAPEEFAHSVHQFADTRSDLIWVFRTYCGMKRRESDVGLADPSFAQLELIVRLTGQRYKNCKMPDGGSTGNNNPWDAAEFVNGLVNRLSADPSSNAAQVLARLCRDDDLYSYRNGIKHALASQRVRMRDAAYRQPSWTEAIATLSNGVPANIGDLHALVLEHLHDLKMHISSANTDVFKGFWNEDGYGRIQTPKSEESCRDVLVGLLRGRLQGLNIHVEPEGHMVADKRADIVLTLPGMKLVVELKRDYHAEVWTAVEHQLARLYVRDPEAKGFGLYGVFWYGAGVWPTMPLSPGAQIRPETAAEMEAMLNAAIPVEQRPNIRAVVIDVSEPKNRPIEGAIKDASLDWDGD